MAFCFSLFTEDWRNFFLCFAGLSVLGVIRIGALVLVLLSTILWSTIAYFAAGELIQHDVMLTHYLPPSTHLIFAIAAAAVVIFVRTRTYDLPLAEWATSPQRALSVAEIVFWALATLPDIKSRYEQKSEPETVPNEPTSPEPLPRRSIRGRLRGIRGKFSSFKASMKQGIARSRRPVSVDDAIKTLGLPAGSSSVVVKRRYRELMMEYHPDRLNNLPERDKKRALARCIEISLAYRALARRRFAA